MNRIHPTFFILALAAALTALAGSTVAHAQNTGDSRPVARLVPDPGPIQIQRQGQETPTSISQTTNLFAGDVVTAGTNKRALVYFDAPPVRTVREGEELVIKPPSETSQTPRPGSSSLWAAFWTTLGRLADQEVEGPPVPRNGGVRAGDTTMGAYLSPSLVLPERSTSLATRPTITWWPAGQPNETYRLTIVEGADPVGCWGGTPTWRGEVTDTTWTYPASEPPLADGETYRIEVLASNQQVDYKCYDIAPDEERARLLETRSTLEDVTGLSDTATQQLFWAGVLAETGHYPDALSLLQDLRQTYPDFYAARELWHALLHQAVQTSQ